MSGIIKGNSNIKIMKDYKKMTDEELTKILFDVKKEIESRQTKKTVLFNAEEYFERYNGGWCKSVTGLDKSKTNGYSIVGDFMSKRNEWYVVGNLYLDCGIGGSRKNQQKYYTLFTVNENANVIVIKEIDDTPSWATNLWDSIEKYQKP